MTTGNLPQLQSVSFIRTPRRCRRIVGLIAGGMANKKPFCECYRVGFYCREGLFIRHSGEFPAARSSPLRIMLVLPGDISALLFADGVKKSNYDNIREILCTHTLD